MFESYGQFQANSVAPSGGRQRYDPGIQAVGRAVSVFHSLHWRAQFRRAWSKLTRRSHRLLDLDDVRRTRTLEAMHEAGCLTIEVKRIRGSECRVCDFDDEFLPLKSSTEQRWAAIYAAAAVWTISAGGLGGPGGRHLLRSRRAPPDICGSPDRRRVHRGPRAGLADEGRGGGRAGHECADACGHLSLLPG